MFSLLHIATCFGLNGNHQVYTLTVIYLLGHLGVLLQGTEVNFSLLLEERRKISPDIIDMRIDTQSQHRIVCNSPKVVWSRYPIVKLKQDIVISIQSTPIKPCKQRKYESILQNRITPLAIYI
jgi:hypothetical protein